MNKINFEFLYPSITDINSAKKAVKYGYASAALMSAITTFNLLVDIFESKVPDVVYIITIMIGDILPIAILGYMIFKMSRIASILALLLCLFELYGKYESRGSVGLFPIFIIFYISAIRGTFLYQKFMRLETIDIGVAKEKKLL